MLDEEPDTWLVAVESPVEGIHLDRLRLPSRQDLPQPLALEIGGDEPVRK